MDKLRKEDGMSKDIVSEDIAALKLIFPDSFTEDRVNLETLRQLLGDVVDESEEKYGLNWHGKKRARQIALSPSSGTIRPYSEESLDWDKTKNLFIEGDNLEVLKLLQKSYANSVKMIYIDPPYNTDGDFIYPDKYQDNLSTYLKYTGQVDDESIKISSNTEASGRKHTNWLNMMFPRLKLARNLLNDVGIIVCHIDEHEFPRLTSLMDEIFGVENCIGPIIWDKRNPKGDATKIATQHEYILIYAKNINILKDRQSLKRPKENAERILLKAKAIFSKQGKKKVPHDLKSIIKKYSLPIKYEDYEQLTELDEVNSEFKDWLKNQDVSGGEAAYCQIDEKGDVFQSVSMAWPNKQKAPDEYHIPLIHPITDKPCPVPERGWRNPPDTMKELLSNDQILFGPDELTQPRRKYLLKENMHENIPSIIPFGGSDDALLKELEIPFDNPKPVKFVKTILKYFLDKDSIVIDFFSGSGTTAHACINLNIEQNSSHRFIMIQLPEQLNPKKREQLSAFKFCEDNGLAPNIASIGKERIRRASLKIKEENPKYSGDLGFKVFKLDTSNIRVWEPNRKNIEQTLLDHSEHIMEGRLEDDVLYELLLKRGVDLSAPIENKDILDKKIYSIGFGALFVCLSKSIKGEDVEPLAEGIINWQKELDTISDTLVVFRDSAFEDDVSKTNMNAILNQGGILNVRSL